MTVVQAIPKGDRGELAVEVLTEIGVARIVPWAAARSVAVWRGERAAKSLGQVALHRARGRQAGAAVVVPRGRRRWRRPPTSVALVAAADLAVVLHEDATAPLRRPRRSPARLGRAWSSAPRAA